MQAREGDVTAEMAGTDWRATADEVAESAAELASEAKKGARRVANDASQSLRGAKERVSAAYGRTTETAERAYLGARGYATENPGTVAAVTFAAGVGLGMMLAPRNGRNSYGRGLLPVVAIAVAQTVLDVFDRAR